MDHTPGRRADEVRKYAAITFPTECGAFITSPRVVFFDVSKKKNAWAR